VCPPPRLASARRRERGIEGGELLAGARQIVLEQLAVDLLHACLGGTLFFASHVGS